MPRRKAQSVARALQGEHGGNGFQIDAALEGAALALERWDASLAAFERRIEAEAATSSSDEAQLRTSFGALLIERGRIDDALRELGRAIALAPTLSNAWLLKGLAGELSGHDDQARQAFFAAFATATSDPVAAYHVVRFSKDGSPERIAAMRVLVGAHARLLVGPQGGQAPFIHTPLLEEARFAGPLFLPHWYAPVLPLLAQRSYDAVVGKLRERWRMDPLRNDPATRSLPIVMITSRFTDKHHRLAMEAGVDAFLTKPYSEDHLLGVMERLLMREAVVA